MFFILINKLNKYFKVTVFSLFALLSFSLCKKAKSIDGETQTVVDFSICETQLNSALQTILERETYIVSSQGYRLKSCENAKWTCPADTIVNELGKYISNSLPTFTLEFKESTCLNSDGGIRLGKMYITPTHKSSVIKTFTTVITSTTTVVFDKYVFENVSFEGKVILIKTGNQIKALTNGSFISLANSFKIIYSSDNLIELNSDGTIRVSGVSNGINREGRRFTAKTSSLNPLVKLKNCKFISSGITEIMPLDLDKRTLSFGSGACDNDAFYTLNEQVIAFKLKNN